ncbi:hypothetical protein ADUPG1_011541 [Aduncisulcus paluster]|uniref:phosphoserine phosphatase n=1 Tax=Aduncisulcus paluster TaxID=2918883 RepID=A0ABQ5K110_9EUKA|nr:hypothetical protein ADUPG1_011541 [Aduncisulcus paluster]
MTNKYKVAFFDVDDTLTIGNVWQKVHSSFKTLEHSLKHWKQFRAKEITYSQWIEKDVAFWIGKTRAEVISAFKPIKLVPGASEALHFLQSQGVLIVLISGGLLCNCVEVAKSLDIEPFAIFSNELIFSEDEKVFGAIGKCSAIHTDLEPKHVDAHEIEGVDSPSVDDISSPTSPDKASFEQLKKSFSIDHMLKGLTDISKGEFVRRFCSELGLSKDDVISVGDGMIDITLFKESKLSFAVNTINPSVIEAASHHCDYKEMISILKAEFP